MQIAVLDDYQRIALASADWSTLAGRAEVSVFADHLSDPEAVVARLHPFDVVVAMRERTPFPRAVLARLPNLKLLVTTGRRNDSIDLEAAREAGIPVCGTGISAIAAPELTWGLLLALARHIPAEDAGVRRGGWQTTTGVELAGRTLGVLGLGRIGTRIARYARAFDMTVLAWSQNLTEPVAREHGARLVSKAELFELSDIVTIHVKLSDRTRGLVGAAELDLLGPRGLLVNTSRGPVVDEAALVAALQESRIGGAALDVFDVEPLPAGHPLRTAPNTVLTPHVGYGTAENYAVFYADAIADIEAWLAGEPVRLL
jgi:phosphoglycerate dehydrogenase-like enzyme